MSFALTTTYENNYFQRSITPIFETSLFKIGGCNYRSRSELYGQSRKLVSLFKVSLLQD
jgi:hypothetical protein